MHRSGGHIYANLVKSVSTKTDIANIWFINKLHLENYFAVKIIFLTLNKLKFKKKTQFLNEGQFEDSLRQAACT